jgi:hypothetical protein
MLFLAGLLAVAHATTVTTDDDVYCNAATPVWFNDFYAAVAGDTTFASAAPPSDADQATELAGYEVALGLATGTMSTAPMMSMWWVDTAAHTAAFDPPMRHCEVHYVCLQWAGWEYDFTNMNQQNFGETLGNSMFLTPSNAQAMSCAFYYCAREFYGMDDTAIAYYEHFLSYAMGATVNNDINTDLDLSEASCSCNDELALAYPYMNDQDSVVASTTASLCVNDLSVGGLYSGGWLWFCEKLACITAIDSKFTDYYTCTLKQYYDTDWEACPTNMQWLQITYGFGYGGQFMTHLLSIFLVTFVSVVPFVMLYGVCCGGRRSNKLENGV